MDCDRSSAAVPQQRIIARLLPAKSGSIRWPRATLGAHRNRADAGFERKRMGTQSTINPMRGLAHLLVKSGGFGARVCLAAFGLGGAGWPVLAQTQAAVTPLVLPSAIVFDAQGNLYFAETGNHVVRKLSAAGV